MVVQYFLIVNNFPITVRGHHPCIQVTLGQKTQMYWLSGEHLGRISAT